MPKLRGSIDAIRFICVGCGTKYDGNSVYPNLLAGRPYCDECAYELDRTGYEVPILDDGPAYFEVRQLSLFAGCASDLRKKATTHET